MRQELAIKMVKIVPVVLLTLISHAAMANCTPAENNRMNALAPLQYRLIAKLQAGDCSAVSELNGVLAAGNTILRDTERRIASGNNPLQCYMNWKTLPPANRCGCKDVNHVYVCSRSTKTVAAKQPTQPLHAAAKTQPLQAAAKTQPPQVNPQPPQAATKTQPSTFENQQSTSCSDITGTGGGPGPTNCMQNNGIPPNLQRQINQSQASLQGGPTPPRVVVLPPPQCNMCDVLKTVGEVLPDFAEKLDNIKMETINDVEPPLFDGGPNTLHPFLPPTPLAPVTDQQDPLDAINDMKDLASNAKALSDLTGKDKEPEDYAQKCQDGFLDAAWKAFTAKDGSYAQKAKAARDSLKECWKAAAKHIEDTLTNGGVHSDSSSGDN